MVAVAFPPLNLMGQHLSCWAPEVRDLAQTFLLAGAYCPRFIVEEAEEESIGNLPKVTELANGGDLSQGHQSRITS